MPRYNKDIQYLVTKEDVRKMIERADNPRDRFLVAILYLTGARPSEVIELKKDDIQIIGDWVVVRLPTKKLKKGKFTVTHRKIEIPKSTEFVDYILEWKNVCPTEKLLNINDSRVRQIIYKLSDNKLCPYNFRHTRLTKVAEAGATVGDLKSWKGADDIRSISPYLKARPVGRKLPPSAFE